MLRPTGRPGQAFTQPIHRGAKLPPEANPWWWNPRRVGTAGVPGWFLVRLNEIDDKLTITWNRYGQHYSVWMRKDRMQTPICQGWTLLFNVHPRELDNRVFHRLYSASADKWGNAKEYFLAVEREFEREKEKRARDSRQETIDIAMETFDHSQIKVSMYGPSSGSKFSTYHS